MPTISVRITESEKKELSKFGPLSASIREGLRLYLNTRKSRQWFRKLEELQQMNPITTTTLEEVRLIREDRDR
jgi:hypothetical protein